MESTESTISTPRSAIFEFWNLDTNEHLTLNHLLLTFKMYIYNARTTVYLKISHLLTYMKSIKDTEKKLGENDAKRKKINKKWKNDLINLLKVTKFYLGCTYINMRRI